MKWMWDAWLELRRRLDDCLGLAARLVGWRCLIPVIQTFGWRNWLSGIQSELIFAGAESDEQSGHASPVKILPQLGCSEGRLCRWH
jgi:hypothetical protein